MSDAGSVLVVAEVDRGQVSAQSLELLGLARGLAPQAGGVHAALLGDGVRSHAERLISHGADRVFVAEHADFAAYRSDPALKALQAIITRSAAGIVLIGHSPWGADLAPRLGFRIGSTAVTAVTGVEREADGARFTRACYGGNARETTRFLTAPAVASVKSGVGEALDADASRRGEIVDVAMEFAATERRVRVVATERDTSGKARLEDAKTIVAGGRGLNGADGFELLAELAEVLGAAVGASRVACDLGWCPHSWQIGLTGKTVSPDLYIAVGISGAGQHMAGCAGARGIVAINSDPEAAIFRDAMFGVVGDCREFVPALTQAIRKLRA